MYRPKIGIMDCVVTALTIFLPIGAGTFFSACRGMKEDGSPMICHWAGILVIFLGIAMAVVAAACLLVPDRKMKAGLSFALVPTAVLTALTPGVLIPLCTMANMHCRMVLRPATIIVSAAIGVAAVINGIVQLVKARNEQRRKEMTV